MACCQYYDPPLHVYIGAGAKSIHMLSLLWSTCACTHRNRSRRAPQPHRHLRKELYLLRHAYAVRVRIHLCTSASSLTFIVNSKRKEFPNSILTRWEWYCIGVHIEQEAKIIHMLSLLWSTCACTHRNRRRRVQHHPHRWQVRCLPHRLPPSHRVRHNQVERMYTHTDTFLRFHHVFNARVHRTGRKRACRRGRRGGRGTLGWRRRCTETGAVCGRISAWRTHAREERELDERKICWYKKTCNSDAVSEKKKNVERENHVREKERRGIQEFAWSTVVHVWITIWRSLSLNSCSLCMCVCTGNASKGIHGWIGRWHISSV